MSAASTIARTATVTGREHVRLGRNNQDGVFTASRAGTTVAVVTDGCSSQPFSEVGARLGARRFTTLAASLTDVPLREVPGRTFEHFTSWLRGLVTAADGDEPAVVLEQYGLFTVLCAVQRGSDALVFGAGDGAFLVDDVLTRLDSGDDNAPPYLGYRLAGRDVQPVVHFSGSARRVALLTDGLGQVPMETLTQLFDDPHVWSNPVHLQRRLNVLHERHRFSDDATLALLETRAL